MHKILKCLTFLFVCLFLVLELNQVIIPTYGTVPEQQNLHTPEWVGTSLFQL